MAEIFIPTKEEFTAIIRREIREALASTQGNHPPTDQWFTIEELCNYLPGKPARATIYTYVSNRSIPHKKTSKRLVFLKSNIDQWLSDKGRKTISEIQSGVSDSLKSKGKKK